MITLAISHLADVNCLLREKYLLRFSRDAYAKVREARMTRKIEVTVGNLAQALDRFDQAWQRGAAKATRSAEIRLTFESLPLLLANLTPARWTLLEALKRSGPMSINALARLLGRN